MNIASIVGVRPNFVKAAPVARELESRGIDHTVIHTGQHTLSVMTDPFYEQLRLAVDVELQCDWAHGRGQQVGVMFSSIFAFLQKAKFDLVLVYGDANTALAGALAASSLLIPIGHVEAGLRSNDFGMPEEWNRIAVDRLSDFLFVPSADARLNIEREEIWAGSSIVDVGNVMIDSLIDAMPRFPNDAPENFGLKKGEFFLATFHRPALVDDPAMCNRVKAALVRLAKKTGVPIIFPVHPRSRTFMSQLSDENLLMVDSLDYLTFLSLMYYAKGVITDSGGVQEETTYFEVPCFTLRDNTERPITLYPQGTNILLGLDPERIESIPDEVRRMVDLPRGPLPLWDGHAAVRIVDAIETRFDTKAPGKVGAWSL